MRKTYREGPHFYAIIYLSSNHSFYMGPYKSRSTAYRVAVREEKRQEHARKSGMIVNYRI